ncbi:hypothetical protein [Microseira wollei]|uniref:Uncharacterized protein n=1 Tax=Microseira wollei NIES-4236 TaxID=2530354 RepID=A0AAV3WJF2_9CYAN|nr:hypothetical protein [Microseira wollei]GET40179.1 hypothetical protein MiSe_49870 [Microseira wollei NIES-4236]
MTWICTRTAQFEFKVKTRQREKLFMDQVSQKPLKPNPFTTYRDAKTGRWIVVLPDSVSDKLTLEASASTSSSI